MNSRPWWSLQTAIFAMVGLITLSAAPSAFPAEADEATQAAAKLERLDAAVAKIEELRPLYRRLAERSQTLAPDAHLERTILHARINRTRRALLNQINTAATLLVELKDSGEDFSDDLEALVAGLQLVPQALFNAIDRESLNIGSPDDTMSPAEQAAGYARASITIDLINELLGQVERNLELQRQFELNVESLQAELHRRLEDRAAAYAAFLDVATTDVRALSAQQAALPDDTDISGRLAVARQRAALAADALRDITALMKSEQLDTSIYDSQLIAVTGEITTDILDFSVLRELLVSAWQTVTDWLDNNGASLIFSLLMFVGIVLITFRVAAIVQRLVTSALHRESVRLSQLLQRMIVSTTRGIIIAIGFLLALSQLGISLGPLLAGLGIAGFVIGFALQDTLSNFASGLMILFYRPFDVGDVVEAGGAFGKVSKMSLVNTTILTLDHQTLVLPNNKIWGDVIKNLTAQTQRRVDMMFGIGYADDIPKTEQVLQRILDEHPLILEDPEPMVRLHELGDSSVNFIVRPWVKTEDYWQVYWDVTREVKMTFDAEGISIPFPQRDVHFYAETPVAVSRQEDS